MFVPITAMTAPWRDHGDTLTGRDPSQKALGISAEGFRSAVASLTPSRRLKLLEVPDNALDPAIEVRDVELLVGGVEVVVGQSETHHDAGNLEHVLEVGDDGNAAAGANED